MSQGFPGGSVVKNLPANAGDMGSIPGSGIAREEGNSNTLQYSGLENAVESPLLSRSGGQKGLRGSGAGTLGVPLGPRSVF